MAACYAKTKSGKYTMERQMASLYVVYIHINQLSTMYSQLSTINYIDMLV